MSHGWGYRIKLTDKGIETFVKEADQSKKLADGNGLHLFITPAGTPTWRIKSRHGNKENSIPSISIRASRLRRRVSSWSRSKSGCGRAKIQWTSAGSSRRPMPL